MLLIGSMIGIDLSVGLRDNVPHDKEHEEKKQSCGDLSVLGSELCLKYQGNETTICTHYEC